MFVLFRPRPCHTESHCMTNSATANAPQMHPKHAMLMRTHCTADALTACRIAAFQHSNQAVSDRRVRTSFAAGMLDVFCSGVAPLMLPKHPKQQPPHCTADALRVCFRLSALRTRAVRLTRRVRALCAACALHVASGKAPQMHPKLATESPFTAPQML